MVWGAGGFCPTVLRQMFIVHGVEGSRCLLLPATQEGLGLPAAAAVEDLTGARWRWCPTLRPGRQTRLGHAGPSLPWAVPSIFSVNRLFLSSVYLYYLVWCTCWGVDLCGKRSADVTCEGRGGTGCIRWARRELPAALLSIKPSRVCVLPVLSCLLHATLQPPSPPPPIRCRHSFVLLPSFSYCCDFSIRSLFL